MKTVVALFSDPNEAEQAIKKLADSDIDVKEKKLHDRHTIESSSNVRAMPSANTAMGAGSAPAAPISTSAGAGGGAFLTDDSLESYLTHAGVDGEELAFYKHGIREGGSLIVARTSDSDAEKTAKLLQEAGGRAAQAN
ncbi:MAG: hypothetical protein ACOC1I_02820 [Spirochaetota bacterium]